VVLLLVLVFLARNYVARVMKTPAPPPAPATRSTISIPANRVLDAFTVSRDGRWLAYTAERADGEVGLFVRAIDEAAEHEMPASTGARHPFFAPDGASVAYFARGAIWKASIASDGAPVKICEAPTNSAGGAWTPDGRIIFAPLGGAGLMSVAAGGGAPAGITTLNKKDGEIAHGWPLALPSGALVFTVSQKGHDAHLETLSVSNARASKLVPALGQAEYVATGHLVYSFLGDLFAVPFDSDELTPRGVPVSLARGIQSSGEFDQLGHASFAVSPNGTLAWLPASAEDQRSVLARVDFHGAVVPLAAQAEMYQTPRISADGRHVAVVTRSALMTRDIRILDNAHPNRVQSTIEGGDNQSPAWMPDGRLSFASNRDGTQKIYVMKVGAGSTKQDPAYMPKPLFSLDGSSARNPASWLRMPPLLAFYEIDQFRSRDILVYRVGEAILPVAATRANERSPWLAPDGRSIAYVSDASGRDEVYVKRLDQDAPPKQLSDAGGTEPVWTKAGLMYREGDKMLRDGNTVFEGRFEHDPAGNAAAYDVDPKGQYLLMLKSARRPREIQIVRNWGTVLMQQVRTKN